MLRPAPRPVARADEGRGLLLTGHATDAPGNTGQGTAGCLGSRSRHAGGTFCCGCVPESLWPGSAGTMRRSSPQEGDEQD